ncbi:MAG: PEP-CTERM sorting domain-containing protein [Verrucomicrobiota bacterium]
MKRFLGLSSLLLAAAPAGNAAALLGAGDFIVAVNANVSTPNSNYPGGEPPSAAIDGTSAKYLNGGNAGTGFIVTPAAASVMQSFVIQTGGDANYRDPGKYKIYGTNDAITSTDNSTGSAENWTLISSGSLGLTNDRNANSAPYSFANSTSYSSYKIVFPETKYTTGEQAMQINEFTAFTGTGGTGTSIFAPGNAIIAIDTPVSVSFHRTSTTYFTGSEGADMLLDGSASSKYLNYAKSGSGFIVTPASGSSVVQSFTVTTANDAEGRDPVDYTLYGTTVPITTEDNGLGTEDGNVWTLISAGNLTLAADRLTTSGLYTIPGNSTAFTSYKMIFGSIKNPTGENSMQLGGIQFYDTIPEPSAAALAGLAVVGFGIRRRRATR